MLLELRDAIDQLRNENRQLRDDIGPLLRGEGGHRIGGASESDESDWDKGSESNGSDDSAYTQYLPVTRDNPYWSAKHGLADEANPKPGRLNLYGHPTADMLNNTSNGGSSRRPGTLSNAFSYIEPLCLFLWQIKTELSDVITQLDARGDDPAFDALAPISNSINAVYDLANEHRELIKLRAKSLAPGASEFTKDFSEYVQDQFAGTIDPVDDMPSAIAELQSEYRSQTQKAHLRHRAARTGRSGTGVGRDRRDDSRRNRSGDDSDDDTAPRRRGTRGGKKHRRGNGGDGGRSRSEREDRHVRSSSRNRQRSPARSGTPPKRSSAQAERKDSERGGEHRGGKSDKSRGKEARNEREPSGQGRRSGGSSRGNGHAERGNGDRRPSERGGRRGERGRGSPSSSDSE
jgi:hypothetical protein